MKRPAVFLDRDGTIIEDTHYIRDPALVKLLPDAIEGLKRMREKGYLLFVVSNQSGVGQGIISSQQFWSVHRRCCELLQKEGVEIEEFGYCFHQAIENCQCRKPEPGLIPKRFGDVELDWEKSFTVGDKLCDLHLATRIGAKGFLVLTGKGESCSKSLAESGDAERYPQFPTLKGAAEALPRIQ